MGTHFALTLNLPKKEKAKRPKIRELNLGFWVFALLILFSIVYLIQVTSLSTKGYEIKKLEARLLELKESSSRLELEAASLKSIQNIEQQVKTLNLVPSGAVKYLGETDFAYR